jgi:PiT family inorganic phosphate transporter
MAIPFLLVAAAVALGLYTSFMGGANDFANSFGTSVGSRAISLRTAVLIAACSTFTGAVLVGGHVTDTVRKGIIDPSTFVNDPQTLALGMLAALISAGLFLQVSTFFGLPVSTTHSIVGAVVGFGMIAAGFGSVEWGKLGQIAASWVISPLFGGTLAFIIFRIIRRKILATHRPPRAARRVLPVFIGIVAGTVLLSFLYKGLQNLHLDIPLHYALPIACAVALVAAWIGRLILSRPRPAGQTNSLEFVEKQFRYLQVVTASYVAFAHGANDVANGIGPVAAIVYLYQHPGDVTMKVAVPVWILALGGFGIVMGLAVFGRRVLETVGKKITEVTASRGFTAEFAAASTVLLCSKLGLPVSTTHTLVGAVIGVGFARGIGALDLRVVRNIVISWLVTLPATILLAMIAYKLLIAFVR